MSLSARIRRQVCERAGWRCQGRDPATGEPCGLDLRELQARKPLHKYLPAGRKPVEIDHIVPQCDGGSDDLENLQALCGHCHHEKTTGERPAWKRAGRAWQTETVTSARRSVPRPASKGLRLRGSAPLKHYSIGSW